MVAVAGDEGMPSARNGIIAPPVAALFAASGPATPSMRPVPNSSGRFDRRFSIAYDTKVEMMCAAPGKMPMKKPTTEPRGIGPAERRQSSRVGRSADSFGLMTSRMHLLLDVHQDLRDAEQAHRDGQEADTVPEVDAAVREPGEAGQVVDADHRDGESENDHHHRPQHRPRPHVGEHDEAEHHEGELLGRPERQRHARERGRQQHQAHHAQRPGDVGADRGDR